MVTYMTLIAGNLFHPATLEAIKDDFVLFREKLTFIAVQVRLTIILTISILVITRVEKMNFGLFPAFSGSGSSHVHGLFVVSAQFVSQSSSFLLATIQICAK